MYKLGFEPNELGRQRYEICSQAFIMTTRIPQPNEYDEVVDTMRLLKQAGVPTNIAQGRQLYDLHRDGSIVMLTNPQHRCLIDYIKTPIWQPVILEQVVETRKWLEGLAPERDENGVANA